MPRDSTSPPSGLPSVALLVDGSELASRWQLLGVNVVSEVNRIPQARIVLFDGDAARAEWALSDQPLLEPGKPVEILAGYDRKHESIFEGIIVRHGIESRQGRSSRLTIVCKGIAVKLTRGYKSRCFYDVADSDVIKTMIGEAGAQAEVTATQPTFVETVQYQATDWDWMLARAEANGLFVVVDGDTIRVAPPEVSDPVVTLTYGDTMLEFEGEIDCEQQWSAVTTAAWSHADQAVVEVSGKATAVPETGNLAPAKLSEVLAIGPFHQHHGGALLDSELSAWGNSIATRAALAALRGRVRCQGVAAPKPGLTIELLGVGERFSGPAWVSAVRHDISPSNWVTDIQFGLDPDALPERQPIAMPPAAGLVPPIAGLHVGVVSKLEGDPDGAHRIQVRLPLVDTEGDGLWSRVCTLDAGSDRGTSFLPEIDDEVLVGFVHGDPRQLVVVGMLHSAAHPPPIEASDNNHKKGYKSRSEIQWTVDDEKKSLTVKMPSGRVVTLDDDVGEIRLADSDKNTVVIDAKGVAIESAADIVLTAKGDLKFTAKGDVKLEAAGLASKTDGDTELSAANLSFAAQSDAKLEATNLTLSAKADAKLEGLNVEHSATASFKANGTATAELTSSGIAKVEGTLVTIN